LTSTVALRAKLYWWSFGTKVLSLTVSKIFSGDAMVDITLNNL